MYDVPPIGIALPLRGARGVTLTLAEFAPTHLDAWYGTADVGEETVPCVVVRHAGDVVRRGLGLGARRANVPPRPDPAALLAVVVREAGPVLSWAPPGDPAALARELSAMPPG
jgi:hypothetical protein